MRESSIPLFKIFNPSTLGAVVDEVYSKGVITEGEYADKFEADFGTLIQNPNVCLTNSCTSALDLAAHVCNIDNESEVITTAMTCMATNLPFHNRGAKLRFADVDLNTGNINVDSIKSKLSPKTKAVIMVHWAGNPCKIDEITKAVKDYNSDILIIEDAAHALGASYHSKGDDNRKPIGSHSDFVCFSFQAIKHLSTIDGGAIACKSKEMASRLRKLRWFGLDRSIKSEPGFPAQGRWEQDIKEGGYKYHMNNINAAIGLEQMKTIRTLIGKHITNGRFFDMNISNPFVDKMEHAHGSSYWIYSLLVQNRKHFKNYLWTNGIASDVVHVRNDQYTAFFKHDNEDLPKLEYFNKCLINIPCGWWLSLEDTYYIAKIVNEYDPKK